MTASSGSPRSVSIASRASACGTERGKPSSRKLGLAPPGQLLADHADDDGVGHQLARVHEALRLAAEVAAVGDRGAQQVAGGEVQEVVFATEALGLGALPGSGRAEEDEPGYFRNPSYERIISWASIWRMVSSATPTTIRIDVPPSTPKNTLESGRYRKTMFGSSAMTAR